MTFKAVTVLQGSKISYDMKNKKFRDYLELYKLHASGKLGGTDIGLPCMENRLVIIDVDVPSETHRFDGRRWMQDNIETYPELNDTYRVETPSGGCHFYLKLPEHIDFILFQPRKALAKGVDVIWKGFVVAPPTAGYKPIGKLAEIKPISLSLIEAMGYEESRIEGTPEEFKINPPLSKSRQLQLLQRLKNTMPIQELDYQQWLEGIFSIVAAVDDEELREDCLIAWTDNKSYKEGDELLAFNKAKTADPHGGITAGTIIKFLDQMENSNAKSTNLVEKITTEMIVNNPKLFAVEKEDGTVKIPPSESNAVCILEVLYPYDFHKREDKRKQSLYLDNKKREVVINGQPFREDTKELENKLIYEIQQTHRMIQFKPSVVAKALEIFCSLRKVDPIKEKILTLKWDGKERIDQFFIDYVKGEGGLNYLRQAGLTMWRSLVYRAVNNGHKCDETVILQGPEGQGKSMLCDILSMGHFYPCGSKYAFEDRDCLLNMAKSLIVEIEEAQAILSDTPESVKGFLTRTTDPLRQMFGKSSVETPRGFILVATCNRKHILTSGHGVRRYIPVHIPDKKGIDIYAIEQDRDQMYAEAYEHFKLGKKNYGLIPNSEREQVVQGHRLVHPWAEAIAASIKGKIKITDMEIHAYLRVGGYIGSGAIGLKTNQTIYEAMDHFGFEKQGDMWIKK